MTRQRFYTGVRGAVVMAIAALLLVGCSATAAPPSEDGSTVDGKFPVTLTHAQGKVTIDAKPERVVVLGSADAQIASALDLPIVGAVRDPSSKDGNWPGVASPLPDEVMVLDSVEPHLEQIAQLKPDIILATTAQPAYSEMYEQLSQIAPVISYQMALLQDSGEDLVTLIGKATGESKKADELIAASDRAVEAFAAEFPQLEGATYAFGQYAGGTTYLIVSPSALSVQFMKRLGLVVPDELSALWDKNDSSYAASVGMITPGNEQLDLLDKADIAFVSAYGEGAAEEFESIPLVSTSRLLRAGQLHLIDQGLAAPLLQPNPATTSYLLDELRPYFEALPRG